jgi:sugar phosphate isomerase/epimerase
MSRTSRRTFLQTGAASLVGASLTPRRAQASPWGRPIGLQLYSVREMLAKDYAGTLRQVAAIGYKEVEAAGFYGRTAPQVKAAMSSAGLDCVGAHYSYTDLYPALDQIIAFNQQIGSRYVVCSFPGFRNPARVQGKSFAEQVNSFTLDDFRWNADQFNRIGAKVAKAGLMFAYHNHTMEFTPTHGVTPFNELLRLTDPALVTFEMDCGWVHVGGGDPVFYLRHFPTRITLLHVKDFKPTAQPASVAHPPPPAELGRGTMDYRPIFAAAQDRYIKHYYVEQEGFDMPPLQALRIDFNYMQQLKA